MVRPDGLAKSEGCWAGSPWGWGGRGAWCLGLRGRAGLESRAPFTLVLLAAPFSLLPRASPAGGSPENWLGCPANLDGEKCSQEVRMERVCGVGPVGPLGRGALRPLAFGAFLPTGRSCPTQQNPSSFTSAYLDHLIII